MIAYDDLSSTDRGFPFDNTCDQLGSDSIDEVGARELPGMGGPAGCAVELGSAELDELWIEAQAPPNPSEPRYSRSW